MTPARPWIISCASSAPARRQSLEICTLLNKPARRQVDVPVKYVGFDIPDEFVFGYGLDYGQKFRNLPYVAVLAPKFYRE